MRYSATAGSSAMILCCVAVGNVYPISRKADYEPPYDKAPTPRLLNRARYSLQC